MLGFELYDRPETHRRFTVASIEQIPITFLRQDEVKATLSFEQTRAIIVGLWNLLPPEERPGLKL